jgi:hypothetical protein
MNRRRLIASLLVGAAVAWGMFLAPLQWPRATLRTGEQPGAAPSYFFSWDGRRLVTVHDSARLWDTGSGKRLANLLFKPLQNVTYSQDGTTFAGRDAVGHILVWVRDGAFRREIWNKHLKSAHPHTPIVFARDGRLLYQCGRNWTEMCDVETGELAFDVAKIAGGISRSTDRFQGFFFGANEHQAVAIRLDTGEKTIVIKLGAEDAVAPPPISQWGAGQAAFGGQLAGGLNTSGALAPDGRSYATWVQASNAEAVAVFTPDAAWTLPPFPWHTSNWNSARRLAINCDAKLLAAESVENPRKWIFFGPPTHSERNRIRLIDTQTGREVGAINDAQAPAFAPDNRTLVVALENGDVQLWDVPLRKPWGWIALASAGAAGMTYLLLTWRARRQARRNLAATFTGAAPV